MPHIRFNWIDILFVTLLVRIGYIGFKTGFLPEFFRLMGLLIAFVLSFNNYTSVSTFLSSYARWTDVNLDMISFLSIFLAILFIFKILAILARSFLGSDNIFAFSRFIGLALGFARGILLVSLIYTLFINSPFEYLETSAKTRSFSGKYVSGIPGFIYKMGINFYPGKSVETPLVKQLEEEE